MGPDPVELRLVRQPQHARRRCDALAAIDQPNCHLLELERVMRPRSFRLRHFCSPAWTQTPCKGYVSRGQGHFGVTLLTVDLECVSTGVSTSAA